MGQGEREVQDYRASFEEFFDEYEKKEVTNEWKMAFEVQRKASAQIKTRNNDNETTIALSAVGAAILVAL